MVVRREVGIQVCSGDLASHGVFLASDKPEMESLRSLLFGWPSVPPISPPVGRVNVHPTLSIHMNEAYHIALLFLFSSLRSKCRKGLKKGINQPWQSAVDKEKTLLHGLVGGRTRLISTGEVIG